MGQYFENDSNIKSQEFMINYYYQGVRFELISDNGVFSKTTLDFGTKSLLDVLIKDIKNGKCLDLGCGIGVVGITLTYFNHLDFDYIEINTRASELTKKNLLKYKFSGEVFNSDGYEKVPKKSYDHVFLNPPIRAGKKVIYKLFDDTFLHLNNGGDLTIVIQKKQGAPTAFEHLKLTYKKVELLDKNKGYQIIRAYK